MAHKEDYGYEQTLIYGRYNKSLSTFAKLQAKQKTVDELDHRRRGSACGKICRTSPKCKRFCDMIESSLSYVFHKIGEDWIFLTTLGVIMALLSFIMDFVIEKCQEGKIKLYDALSFSVPLQYLVWVLYSLIFILFATGFTHFVSPQAIGSGIPEMKTVLRGVVLKEYLTFRTLVAKVIGLCSSLGSTLPIGKEGPFVHIASIVATLLGKIVSFRGIYENESRKTEMLAAACAVGVACTFAAPIGGVLFSIEVTSTYFAVRNYWRGFFAAVCGAVVWRLLAHWFKNEETITALFKTHLQTEFPFDAIELFVFAAIGVVCGFAGALFIYLHRKIIIFTRKRKRMSSFLQKNRFIYPGLIAFLVSSLTFPPGLGQYMAGKLTHKEAINELFGNVTLASHSSHSFSEENIINNWSNSSGNVYLNLALFVMSNFCLSCVSNTLPVPAGIFFPVFTVGAGFGRLIGESMVSWFPNGIHTSSLSVRRIIPAGYAVVGAAALSGSVTRTISTSLIVFELTGQISHVLPAVIAVLIANAVAHPLQPSFFDSIITIKRLPYLPDIVSAKSKAWNYCAEDIMVKVLQYLSLDMTYKDLKDLLDTSVHRSYPLVDSKESMILLGSIHRYELEHRLAEHLKPSPIQCSDRRHKHHFNPVSPSGDNHSNHNADVKANPRFTVTYVPDDSLFIKTDSVDFDRMLLPTGDNQLTVPKIARSQSESGMNILENIPKSILKKTCDISPTATTRSESRPHFKEDPIILDEEFELQRQQERLKDPIVLQGCPVDPAPFQLVERTSLYKVHSLFSLLGLNRAYVTNTGRLVGVVALKELRNAIQGTIDSQDRQDEVERNQEITRSSSDDELDDPAQLEILSSPSSEYTLNAS